MTLPSVGLGAGGRFASVYQDATWFAVPPVDAVNKTTALVSVANRTKWEELRLAMYALANPPRFQCKDIAGYYSPPDGEWFHHFQNAGYETMRYVDLIVETDQQRNAVRAQLKCIGLAGDESASGFWVYGYVEPGQPIERF